VYLDRYPTPTTVAPRAPIQAGFAASARLHGGAFTRAAGMSGVTRGPVVMSGNRMMILPADPLRPGLGFLEAIGGIVSSIIGANAAKSAAKEQAKYGLEAERIKGQFGLDAAKLATEASRDAARMGLEAAKAAAAADVRRASITADANVDALRVQRLAQIDNQSAQLVANTQAGIFGLSRTGLEQSSAVSSKMTSSAVWGMVLVTGIVLIAANPPKFKVRRRSKSGSRRSATLGPADAADSLTPEVAA
jgi:hypothetical protein